MYATCDHVYTLRWKKFCKFVISYRLVKWLRSTRRSRVLKYNSDLVEISKGETLGIFGLENNLLPSRGKRYMLRRTRNRKAVVETFLSGNTFRMRYLDILSSSFVIDKICSLFYNVECKIEEILSVLHQNILLYSYAPLHKICIVVTQRIT